MIDLDWLRLEVAVRFLAEIADGDHPEAHDPAMIRAWAVAGLREIDRIGNPSPKKQGPGVTGIRIVRIHRRNKKRGEA